MDKDKARSDLVKRLIQAREASGLSTYAASRLTGFSMRSLYHYEEGKHHPPPERVAVLADIYDVLVESLLYGDRADVVIDAANTRLQDAGKAIITALETESLLYRLELIDAALLKLQQARSLLKGEQEPPTP